MVAGRIITADIAGMLPQAVGTDAPCLTSRLAALALPHEQSLGDKDTEHVQAASYRAFLGWGEALDPSGGQGCVGGR